MGVPPSGSPAAETERDTGPGGGSVLSTRLLFMLALTVLAAAYTVMAFGMDWRVEGGQIGPGFFPRLVGAAIVLGCVVAIARFLRAGPSGTSPAPAVDAEGEPEPVPEAGEHGTDARVVLLAVGCMVLYYFVFETLGALLSSVLFLGIVLTVVNRGHHRTNAAVSILLPVGLYVLFEVLLDAGLPSGLVLPL